MENVALRVSFDKRSEFIDYRLALLSDTGEAIETYSPRSGTPESILLGDLYNTARRNAFGVDQKLEGLESILKRL